MSPVKSVCSRTEVGVVIVVQWAAETGAYTVGYLYQFVDRMPSKGTEKSSVPNVRCNRITDYKHLAPCGRPEEVLLGRNPEFQSAQSKN